MPIAYWRVFTGGLLPILVVFIAKADPRLDVYNPRDVHALQTGIRKRAYGAHLNGLEAFPFFAASVLVAYARGVDPWMLDGAALGWVGTRILYTAVYLADLGHVRPFVWVLSVLISAGIFILPA